MKNSKCYIALLMALCPLITGLLISPLSEARSGEGKLGGAPQDGNGRFALVVGINDNSAAAVPSLRYCEQDARGLRDTLVNFGGFSPEHVTLLLGGEATQANIMHSVDSLSNASVHPHADTVLLYFSGHGATLSAGGTSQQFLVPADGSADIALAELRNIPLDAVLRNLNASAFPRKIVLLDVSREMLILSGAKGVDSQGGFDFAQYHEAAQGVKVVVGCKFNQHCYEDDSLRAGVFSHFLLAGLEGAAAQPDHVVTLSSLESYLFGVMARFSRDNPARAQIPTVWGEGSSEIPLTYIPPPTAQPVPATANPDGT